MEKAMFNRSKALEIAISIMNGEYTPTEEEKACIVDHLTKQKATIDKKNSGESKADKEKAQADEILINAFAETMADGVKRTVTEIIKASNVEISTSKGTSILKALAERMNVQNAKNGKRSEYWVVAE